MDVTLGDAAAPTSPAAPARPTGSINVFTSNAPDPPSKRGRSRDEPVISKQVQIKSKTEDPNTSALFPAPTRTEDEVSFPVSKSAPDSKRDNFSENQN